MASVLHSRKYLFNPELRAKRVTELTQNIDVQFCKAFWGITEEYGTQHGPKFICPTLAVNLPFKLPPCGIGIESLDGNLVDVLFPLHGNGAGLPVRLLCFQKMDGQTINAIRRAEPPRRVESDTATSCSPLRSKSKILSKYLMIHCHGGGFVAQTSKSHEIYLRYWAKELKMPILSIDYSLSPEAVYPQALNEAFFAYVWALNNLEKLGTTGEKIVFCGDSAGANLMTSVTLKSIMCNIRLPDSVVVCYPPYRFDNSPTPSRILCLMDALLPMGILKACVQSYAGDPTLFTSASASASKKPTNKEVDVSKSFQFELHSESRHKAKYRSSDNLLIDSNVPPSSYARSFSDSFLADADVRFCSENSDAESKKAGGSEQRTSSDLLLLVGDPKRNERVSDSDSSPDSSPVDGTWEFVSKELCEDDVNENKRNENVSKSGAIDLHDPLMSPIFAPDEILLKMPHVSILACSLDPVFDDSVEFIRKLRSLGKDADLHVVDHLPHGFLNFQPFSNEARAACDLMLGCVRTSLNMDDSVS